MNEYTSVGGTARAHSDNGNLKDDGRSTFVFDYKNRLIGAFDKASGNPVAAYLYYCDNRRAKKVVYSQASPGVVERTERFFYDGNQVVEETDDAGNTLLTWVYSPVYVDEPVQCVRTSTHPLGAATLYLHQNARADVVAVTDAAGAVVERRLYDDYGRSFDGVSKAAVSGSAVGNPYGFQGRRLDAETGLYYFRARYYDPETGRFVQRDPVWDPGNFGNQYSFVGGSPVSGLDPSGELVPLVVIALAAGASVFASDRVAQNYTQYNRGISKARSYAESGVLGVGAAGTTYVGGLAATRLATAVAPGFELAGATSGVLLRGAAGIESGVAAGTFLSNATSNMAVTAGLGYLLTGEVSKRDVALSGGLTALGPLANALGRAKPGWALPLGSRSCPPPRLGRDFTPAEGLNIYRNVSRNHPDIDIGRQGLAEQWGATRPGPVGSRALGHDYGAQEGSGFTAWTVDKAFAHSRQARLGGVVIQSRSPQGSVWANEVAAGTEAQVLVPGGVRGRIAATDRTTIRATVVPPTKENLRIRLYGSK